MLNKIFRRLYTPWNLLILIILLLAFLVRITGIGELLNFHYDQGRDALVIWDLIHQGKFFLIGPTTGLAGVFRGPYYYYLIAPFYFIGGGNPIFPSLFLILTTVLAIYLLYYLVSKFQNKQSALISIILASFSYNLIWASRWLSNPTPMMLLSMMLVWGMYLVVEAKQYGWYLIAFVSGLSLFNFGSSGELFYIPAIVIFLFLNWKNRPSLKTLFISIALFTTTFAPLMIFDLKHNGILRAGLGQNFVAEKSWAIPAYSFVKSRTISYYDSISSKIFHSRGKTEMLLLASILTAFIIFLPSLMRNKFTRIVLLLTFSPLLGLYFYQGNHQVLYEYYLTGYYLIFVFLISLVVGKIWDTKHIGKIFVIFFLIVFLRNNYYPTKFKLSDKSDSQYSVNFINQLQVINYIKKDSEGKKFNLDVYVPPVISYSYDYLFKWQGLSQESNQVNLLYTIYEVDPQHPERLKAWLDRQDGFSKTIDETRFGGITVQERYRIKK